MENDSTEVVSTQQPLPTPQELGINISTPTPSNQIVGDTFDFPITVSWSVNGSAILVVPQGGVNAKGLDQTGLSQQSSRIIKDGTEIATQTFTFKILAKDTGNLNVPAVKFEIPTPMGALELRSENVPVRVDSPSNPMPLIAGGAVGICIILASLWRLHRKATAKSALTTRNQIRSAQLERMLVLKQRINSASSREWLLELEQICKEYAQENFGSNNLEQLAKDGKLEGWESLLEEFAHARYGGGNRDAFQNRETWKGAMKLMGMEEE